MESHGWYQLAPFRWSRDERVLRRREALPEGIVDLEISFDDGRTLRVKGASESEVLRARITRMLQLDVDTTEFIAMTRLSPTHSWVEEAGFGRLLCGTTLWEDAVKIITTTNTMWRQTVRMVELLVNRCGRDGAFPEPEDILRFSEPELQNDCRLGYRAKSIHRLATLFAEHGGVVAQTLLSVRSRAEAPAQTRVSVPQHDGDRSFQSYLTLPGIGPYGAAHLLAMDGRHDFIAVDTEFRRFVRETYHAGRHVSDATMVRRYSKWGRWKYLAYWSELHRSVAERLQPRAERDK